MPRNNLLFQILTAALVALFSFLALIVGSKLAGPLPLSLSQTISQKEQLFSVTGESEMTVVPDEARVTLGIEVNQSTVATAQSQANTIINNISGQLKQSGVDEKDIKTTSYQVSPIYDYESPERRITSYQVSTSLRVKVKDFDKLNTIIDEATAAGANRVDGISFTISDEKEEELKKAARKEAIDNAKDSAQELAKLSGLKLGKIVDVQENQNTIRPVYEDVMLMRADSALPTGGGTNIEAGSTDYKYAVTLSYETL